MAKTKAHLELIIVVSVKRIASQFHGTHFFVVKLEKNSKTIYPS